MGKKKNKQIIRPWCWYCEREFEDEKVLMQHQKAKHFKCNMCPRRLNTAGGLAVHIQQVHKLEPENLPRIENALPGRDGYEVEIFGMEGIPAPDVADYKRRKEIELGLAAGSISQPPPKRPKIENRPLTEEELKAQLEAHKALMGGNDASSAPPVDAMASAVYGAPPQTYAVPPVPATPMAPGMSPQQGFPPVPPFIPGASQPTGYPFPMAGFPPGPPPPGFSMPPGFSPSPGIPPLGMPPFPPGARPPFPPPPFMPPGASPPFMPPNLGTPMGASPTQQPPSSATPNRAESAVPLHPTAAAGAGGVNVAVPTQPTLPNPSLAQTNPDFKKKTALKYTDANFSPEEMRAYYPKYYVPKNISNQTLGTSSVVAKYEKGDVTQIPELPAVDPAVLDAPALQEESRGKKRARAEDFL